MHRFYMAPESMKDGKCILTGGDVNHIKNVLRMKQGDQLVLCDGRGIDYLCEILFLERDRIGVRELSHAPSGTELPIRIILFQGIPKREKMEFIIQKTVELGVAEIVPVAMKRCVAKLEGAAKEAKKLERWQSIAEAAAKQSERGKIPSLHSVMGFSEALIYAAKENMEIVVPYEDAGRCGLMPHTKEVFVRMAEKSESASIGLFIGPEGGIDNEEIALAKKYGAEIISLGTRILRTETAGMAAMAMLMYEIECQKRS